MHVSPRAPLIASGGTNLTDKTPNSLTYVQHGTEEAVISQADLPTEVVVLAWYVARMRPGGGSIAVGDRGKYVLEVSYDGGATWDLFDTAAEGGTYFPITTASRDMTAALIARGTGTLTGDLQVRAMVADVNQANDTQFINGVITVLAHAA